jgi:holo-[acyl-carrier protein] synthase
MIGIDIVSIERFEKFLKRKEALRKYLSDEEILLVTSSSTAAGFFASKEAVSKALQTGIGKSCSFKDIKIHKDSNNAPYFTLSKSIVEQFNIVDSSLSITHDGGFAIAVAYIDSKNGEKRAISH